MRVSQAQQRLVLDSDEMLLFALVRAVEIAGEAASKISTEGRSEVPDVRWHAMIGMRNRLVHAYFDVDRDILWTTVAGAAPWIIARLTAFLGDK